MYDAVPIERVRKISDQGPSIIEVELLHSGVGLRVIKEGSLPEHDSIVRSQASLVAFYGLVRTQSSGERETDFGAVDQASRMYALDSTSSLQ